MTKAKKTLLYSLLATISTLVVLYSIQNLHMNYVISHLHQKRPYDKYFTISMGVITLGAFGSFVVLILSIFACLLEKFTCLLDKNKVKTEYDEGHYELEEDNFYENYMTMLKRLPTREA